MLAKGKCLDDSYSSWRDPTNLMKQIVINLGMDKKRSNRT